MATSSLVCVSIPAKRVTRATVLYVPPLGPSVIPFSHQKVHKFPWVAVGPAIRYGSVIGNAASWICEAIVHLKLGSRVESQQLHSEIVDGFGDFVCGVLLWLGFCWSRRIGNCEERVGIISVRCGFWIGHPAPQKRSRTSIDDSMLRVMWFT